MDCLLGIVNRQMADRLSIRNDYSLNCNSILLNLGRMGKPIKFSVAKLEVGSTLPFRGDDGLRSDQNAVRRDELYYLNNKPEMKDVWLSNFHDSD